MKAIDLAGKRFGKLLVLHRESIYRSPSGGASATWKCRCDCGTEKVFRYQTLAYGRAVSCGCLRKERMKSGLRLTHGMARRHKVVPEYGVWSGMRDRCENPANNRFHLYGARGISVCERWQQFEFFYEDMGPRPTAKHSIDRIDNDGNYQPGNCRWITMKEQANNTSANRLLTFNGVTLTLSQWSERLGINVGTLGHRTGRLGWSIERAFSEPVQQGRRRVRANNS